MASAGTRSRSGGGYRSRCSAIEVAALVSDLSFHLNHAGLDLPYTMAHQSDGPDVGGRSLPHGARPASRGCACFSRLDTTVVRAWHEPTGSIGTCVHTFGFSPPSQSRLRLRKCPETNVVGPMPFGNHLLTPAGANYGGIIAGVLAPGRVGCGPWSLVRSRTRRPTAPPRSRCRR